MATVNDYGQPSDRLSTPSLSLWAAAVAAAVNGNTSSINNTGLWQNWSPTPSGAAFSGFVAKYTLIGKTVHVRVRGTVTAVTGEVAFPAPLPLSGSGYGSVAVGVATLNGAATYFGTVFASSPGTSLVVRFPGTNGLSTPLSATAPFTWASGNTISFTATYETT